MSSRVAKYSPVTVGLAHLLAVLGAVTVLVGCGLPRNAEDGDQEPKVANYRVTIEPQSVYSATPEVPLVVQLSVVCEGASLPPQCDKHPANWIFEDRSSPPFPGTVTIADRKSPTTTATITLNLTEARNRLRPADTSLYYDYKTLYATLGFRPSPPLPNGLTPSGQEYVSVSYSIIPGFPERQEQPREQPKIGFAGAPDKRLYFEATGGKTETKEVAILYSGPPGTLEVTGPFDVGTPNGSARFKILSPRTIPVGLPGDGGLIQVQFAPDIFDTAGPFTAGIFVTMGNNKPVPLLLNGAIR